MTIEEVNKRLNQNYQPMLEAVGSSMPQEEKLKVVFEYIDILNKLRASNISSEIYPGEGKLKKQMEYANKLGSPAVILYGDNEIKLGKATLKNLKSGNESSVKIEELVNEIKKLL